MFIWQKLKLKEWLNATFTRHTILQFPLGFCIASTIRIGQLLGANKAEEPIATACVAIITIGTTVYVTMEMVLAHQALFFTRFCCFSGFWDCNLDHHYLHEVLYPPNIHERSVSFIL